MSNALQALLKLRSVFAVVVFAAVCTGVSAEEEFDLESITPEFIQTTREKAELGVAEAQAALGGLYYKGWGVPQDYGEAVKWYRRAAEQGDASAQFNLGASYHNGEGVPQNYWEAYIWHSLAAANGNEKAAEYRDDNARHLSPADLTSAQKEAARRHAKIQGETDN